MKTQILFLTAWMFAPVISQAQTNYLDSYIGNPVTLTVIAGSANQVSQPRDLDFKPVTNELWVCQYGNSAGGRMNIFYNAGLPAQANELRHDSHADHFFYYPSAIAFGDHGEFAAVSEIQNTNSASPTFMGPSLWLADTAIFARVWQGNWANGYPLGSHIDMLHQSPFSMGVAHDTLKAYWVMDGYNGNICKYDFVQDHGPGYDDHSAGKIWRYTDVTWTRVAQVPSHCVLDRQNHWLYFIDGGGKKVKRMNVNSGSFAGNLTVPSTANEPLAGYYKYLGATVETLDSFSTQPCGIDYYNGRLIVSDYTNGNIYLYNTTGTVSLLDTIVTGHPGMMGVKVGPDGHIWSVNKTENKIYRLDATLPALDAAIIAITSPVVNNYVSSYYSTGFNVCNGDVTPSVEIKNSGSSLITSLEINYSLDGGTPAAYNWSGSLSSGNTASVSLLAGAVTYGSHELEVTLLTVNGSADAIDLNNKASGSFRAFPSAQPLPFIEDFSGTQFPPSNFSYVHFNTNNLMSRSTASAYGTGNGSLQMNNFSGPMNITGQEDYLLLPLFDFSNVSDAHLKFDVAYAQYASTDHDELKVSVSTDCGTNWTQVYDKMGTGLSTAPVTTSAFTPTSSQWRSDSVSLSTFDGQSEVIVMFTSISGYGNNLFVDNISVDGNISNVGVDEAVSASLVSIYPNPVNDLLHISFPAAEKCLVTLRNALGGNIYSAEISGSHCVLNTASFPEGVYFVQVKNGNQLFTRKFIRQ